MCYSGTDAFLHSFPGGQKRGGELMTMRQQCAALAAAVFVSGAAACGERGDMYSEERAGSGSASRTPVTATGCFQDMSGSNNFVLSNVGDAPGASPSETRSYRIEQSGDFEQHVGKKVTITGWVDADAKAAEGMPAGQAKSGDVDFNDLPELHVENISGGGEACGSAAK
jgi:hypothetical protein